MRTKQNKIIEQIYQRIWCSLLGRLFNLPPNYTVNSFVHLHFYPLRHPLESTSNWCHIHLQTLSSTDASVSLLFHPLFHLSPIILPWDHLSLALHSLILHDQSMDKTAKTGELCLSSTFWLEMNEHGRNYFEVSCQAINEDCNSTSNL